MAGVKAYDRETYLEDIRAYRARGLSWDAVATALGMSRATLFRIIAETKRGRT